MRTFVLGVDYKKYVIKSIKFKMNLKTNFQMLDKVNKYADYEFNFFQLFRTYKYLLSIEKARPKGCCVGF